MPCLLLVGSEAVTSIHFALFVLAVEFDDCAGNEDVQFEVSDPSFHVDGDLNLVPQRDVPHSSPVLFIHGISTHADDMAEVEVAGLPVQSVYALRVRRNLCWCLCVSLLTHLSQEDMA